jgi:hypothetical protein
MILGVGFGFCTETLTMPLLIAFTLAILYHFQIKRDEAQLTVLFGYEYDSYVATIPRFLSFVPALFGARFDKHLTTLVEKWLVWNRLFTDSDRRA